MPIGSYTPKKQITFLPPEQRKRTKNEHLLIQLQGAEERLALLEKRSLHHKEQANKLDHDIARIRGTVSWIWSTIDFGGENGRG